MKKTTRMVSLLLALVMLVGILPVMTFAVSDSRYVKEGTLPETAKNVVYLSDLAFVESANLGNKVAIRDGAWSSGATITIGDSDISFDKGLGVMAFNPTEDGTYGAAHTTFDVSGLKSNNFYAVTGITNDNGKAYAYGDTMESGGIFAGGGVVFEVWATYEDGGEYVMLESSGAITKTAIYEFHVNITGVKLLKLVVRCNMDVKGTHTSMNSAWGGACVYSNGYTPNAQINGDGSGNLLVLDEAKQNPHSTYDYINALPAGGTYLTSIASDTTKLVAFKCYSGYYPGSSDPTDTYALVTADDRWIGGYENNPNTVGGKIDNAVKFTNVVQLTPGNDSAHTGYAIYDASKLNGNHFYAAVGNRNQANSTGVYDPNTSTSAFGGIMFEVWGSYDADAAYDTATYELLAQSEIIYNANTGEFDVDITGVKWLKLVNKSNTNTSSSCDGVFANACVYNVDKFDISYSNMGLTNDLAMKFAFKQNSAEFTADHYAEISFRGTKNIVKFADWKDESIDGEAYYSVGYSGVAAKEMTDTFSVTIYDGDGNPVSNTFTDTVQDYCLRRLMQKTYESDPTDAKNNVDALLCRVIVDVLNYGAAAQTHFKHNENDLANDVLIAKFAALGGAEPEAAATSAATKTGDLYVATNVALESNIRMAFGFTGLTDGMTAKIAFTHHNATAATTINVTSDEFTTRDDFDGQVILLDELVVADCRQDVTVTIYDASGKALASVTDSVARYLARKAASEDSDVFDALLTLSDSAYAYFYAYDNPDERQSGTLSSHQVLATDITNGRIVVADLDKTDPFATSNLDWSYTISGTAGGLSDAKVRMRGSSMVVLYTDSRGAVGMIDYETKATLWQTNVTYSPHAIELLPNGDIVVISSGGGTDKWQYGKITYFDMNGNAVLKSSTFSLNGGHGVVWDPANNLLWVSGFLNIEAYKLKTDTFEAYDYESDTYYDREYVTLEKIEGKGASIPGQNGHDLMQDYSDPDILWITDTKNVYQFSKSKNEILSEYPGSEYLLSVTEVKGITSFSDGVVALAAGGYSTTIQTYWPLNNGSYELVKYTNASYGFNKVRIFTTDYQ